MHACMCVCVYVGMYAFFYLLSMLCYCEMILHAVKYACCNSVTFARDAVTSIMSDGLSHCFPVTI